MRSAVVDLATQPIRNLLPNPSFELNKTGWQENAGRGNVLSTDWSYGGGQSLFLNNATVSGTLNLRTATGSEIPVRPGVPYTCSAYVKPTSYDSRHKVQIQWFGEGLSGLGTSSPTSVALPIEGQRLWHTGIAPAGAVSCRVWVQGTTIVPSDVTQGMYVDKLMLTEGTTLWPYADGHVSGWSWAGTVGSSESAGYPYTLESIAGRPTAMMENVTSGTILGPLPADGPFTIVSYQGAAEANSLGLWNVGTSQRRRLLINPSSIRTDVLRADSTVFAINTPADTSKMHALVARVNDSGMGLVMDGTVLPWNTPATAVDANGTGDLNLRVGYRDSNTYFSVVTRFIAIFPYEMNDATAVRVSQWLTDSFSISSLFTDVDGGTPTTTNGEFDFTWDGGSETESYPGYNLDGGSY